MPSKAALEHEQSLRNPNFECVSGPAGVVQLILALERLGAYDGPLGVDTETTGLDPREDRVCLVQVASPDFALVVDLRGWRSGDAREVPWEEPGLAELRQLLEGPRPKVLQNAAFDLNFLLGEGVVLGGPLFDTMIAAKLVNNGTGAKNDLGSLVPRVLKCELPKELQKSNWGGEHTHEMLVYAARDAICLPRMCGPLTEALEGARVQEGTTLWDIFRLEMQALRPIALMQWNGFGFDLGEALALRESLQERADALQLVFLGRLDEAIRERHPEDEGVWLPREADGSFNTREKDSGNVRLGTKRYAGFNPRSPQQMAKRFEQAGILLPPNEKGVPSLDQNLLAFQRNEEPLIDAYLTWKNSVTRVSHVEKLIASVGSGGRIHAGYRQLGAETGRLSCAEPNLQQVPREHEFRDLFKAAPGYALVVADFSQVELRVAAELSGEPRMIEAYQAGRDLHTETAVLITQKDAATITKAERTSAKVANFGLLYGAGPATLQKQAVAQYGIDMPLSEAKALVEGFRSAYPVLYEWQMREGNRTTAAVFTVLGRRRMLVGFNDKYTTRINTQVQGTAGDIAKLAIARIWQCILAEPLGEARLIAMVHDEIGLEVRQGCEEKWAALLKDAMEGAGAQVCQRVPIVAEVSIGATWAEAK
jgi:DNA polymerase I-like protein with 3'-5' exonuclease and polymerase domains